MPQVTPQMKSDWEYQMLTLCLVVKCWGQLCTAQGMDTACFVPSSFCRCPHDWPVWKLTCWALIDAKQFLLSALAAFLPLNLGLDNTFKRKITLFFFFWKLWFSNYLCTPLPPFPTYGSNWLSLISRAPILRNMWVSFVLVSALWGSQFCLLLFRDHTGVLSKLLPITK